jgi:hypothetical protein
VRLTLPMKAFEIGMVMRKHGTMVGDGISENLRIVNALASATCLLDRQYIVPKAQLLDDRQREILIRIESGHAWLAVQRYELLTSCR